VKDELLKLAEQVEEAMNGLIDRLVRAQQISSMTAPSYMRNMRDDYIEHFRAKRYTEALGSLAKFVDVAQDYHETIKSRAGFYSKHWTPYEDQKLRKPIARLAKLQVESQKWEAMRRLRSPAPMNFFQPPSGAPVQITDMTHRPHFDSFVSLPDPKPVDHRVLVAAGLYRNKPSQFPRT